MARAIGRFIAGFVLPLQGGVLLLRHRRLLALAAVPLCLNLLLYFAALALVVHYYEEWFSLLFAQPQAWYWLVGYVVLRLVAFVLLLAALVFSFVFVGTALAAPFLEVLSVRVEHLLQDPDSAYARAASLVAERPGASTGARSTAPPPVDRALPAELPARPGPCPLARGQLGAARL